MIFWRRVSQRAECSCNASRICQPFRPVSHCLERVWEPVHEIQNCWLVTTLGGERMCVKKSLAHLYFVKFSNDCHVQNHPFAPRPLHQNQSVIPSATTISNCLSISDSRLIEIPFRQVMHCWSTFTPFFNCNRFPSSSIPSKNL